MSIQIPMSTTSPLSLITPTFEQISDFIIGLQMGDTICSPLSKAVNDRNIPIIHFLIDNGANPFEPITEPCCCGYTCVIQMILHNGDLELLKIILKNETRTNIIGGPFQSIIFEVQKDTTNYNLDCIKFLSKFCNINARRVINDYVEINGETIVLREGNTLLQDAIALNDNALVDYLTNDIKVNVTTMN